MTEYYSVAEFNTQLGEWLCTLQSVQVETYDEAVDLATVMLAQADPEYISMIRIMMNVQGQPSKLTDLWRLPQQEG